MYIKTQIQLSSPKYQCKFVKLSIMCACVCVRVFLFLYLYLQMKLLMDIIHDDDEADGVDDDYDDD